jgi:hypothetical protein
MLEERHRISQSQLTKAQEKRSRIIKKLAYYLPYILCPLAFFVLLASIQWAILRQAFVAADLRQTSPEHAPTAAAKSSRLPAAIVAP